MINTDKNSNPVQKLTLYLDISSKENIVYMGEDFLASNLDKFKVTLTNDAQKPCSISYFSKIVIMGMCRDALISVKFNLIQGKTNLTEEI